MLRVLICFLCCLIFTSGNSQEKRSNSKKNKYDNIFSVAGKPVTTDEFIYLYKKNHQNKPEEFTKAKIDEYLRLFIDFKLKVQEAKARGMDTTVAFIKEYNSYRAELRKPYLPDNSLVDSLVHLTYERMKEEVRASHILIALKQDPTPDDTLEAYNKIIDIRKQVLSGADFGKLAIQFSQDPSARVNGGDLGYFSSLQMVFPFESAAYNAKIGDVSLPVRTRFGYHLIKVTARRPAQAEIEVSHIMVRFRDEQDQERAKNTIFTVVEQLQAGVRWEDLCKQYSEDPSTKDQGGRLRAFGTAGMAAVPEFEKAAFALQKPGDISDPVKTQYGWHIIRLEKKLPLASYDAVSATLKGRVTRDERTTLSRQKAQEKLRARLNFVENETNRAKAFGLLDSALLKGNWRRKSLAENIAGESLFTLHGKAYTTKNFVTYVEINQKATAGSLKPYIDQLYNGFVEHSINEAAEEDIIQHNPTYSYLLKEYYEGILLFEIMEKEVWMKASNDSVGQKKFYDNNLSKYKAGDRVKAVIYSSSSNRGFQALEALVKVGDERKIQEYIIANQIKMEAGYFRRDEKDVFAKLTWTKGVFAVENKGMYYLAWMKDILAPGAMSFEEARPAIISDYQTYMEKLWLDQLKKKYPVKVNEKGKQYVIQTLQTK
ncbi:MAG: peptidylprolyl isomerase [Chryseolinea sp.]